MENMFNFKMRGRGHLFCFNAECPQRNDCVRYTAGQNVPDTRETGTAVLPAACRGKECRFFKPLQMAEYAYGFEHIYDNVTHKDYTLIRKQLTGYLGNRGRYYHYKHGKIGLSPEQQRYIRDVFGRYGYSSEVVFDKYVTQYDY